MSFVLRQKGQPSPQAVPGIGVPTRFILSGDGLRAFHRSWYNFIFPASPGYEGQINAVDWNVISNTWSIVAGMGGGSGGGEAWDEGASEFKISKNGVTVAWDFIYQIITSLLALDSNIMSQKKYDFQIITIEYLFILHHLITQLR